MKIKRMFLSNEPSTIILCTLFKGIVSRDFRCLQMILMDRIGVHDVPLEVYSFLNLHLHVFTKPGPPLKCVYS